ncbi:hypothetical protein [Vibrio sp.]|uniref:hypothetical protein n=1 Tax=Vibrio sp. TaxID=678 RepID=UPI003D11D8BC
MKKWSGLLAASIMLAGCGGDDGELIVISAVGKNFETDSEKLEYAQYVSDSVAAVVDAVLNKSECQTSDQVECSINGYVYANGNGTLYTLLTTSTITVENNSGFLKVTADHTNPAEQIFLISGAGALVAVNLSAGNNHYIQVSDLTSVNTVSFDVLYVDSQDTWGDEGQLFSARSSVNFEYDSANRLFNRGDAYTDYRNLQSYPWAVNSTGIAFLK